MQITETLDEGLNGKVRAPEMAVSVELEQLRGEGEGQGEGSTWYQTLAN